MSAVATQFIHLQDGRKMAYAVYGDPAGIPLLFFHGTPGTNIMAKLAEEGACMYGFKLIAPDRPGFGESDFQPGREVYHYPLDIIQLLHQLNITHCGIVAISGGAPYAFQCAHDLPQQISYVVSLSGWIAYGNSDAAKIKLSLPFRFIGWSARHCRLLLKLVGAITRYQLQKQPHKLIQKITANLCPEDKKLLNNSLYYQIILDDLKNAYNQGWKGPMQEAALQFSAPGFSFESIAQPVILLHGMADDIAPFAFSTLLRQHLPKVLSYHPIEAGGHFCAIPAQDLIFAEIYRFFHSDTKSA